VDKIKEALPLAYALVGTLFTSFVVKETFIDHTGVPSTETLVFSLRIWGMLAMLFWIRRIADRPVLSLLHSLVIFSLLIMDLIRGSGSQSGRDLIANDMRVYTFSIAFNLICLAMVLIFSALGRKIRVLK
jgi:hypothetical protein